MAVLGGGIGGLTAAHELAERGFSVVVYEARAEAGGKSRSGGVTGSGRDGRRDLPCEHGFRFFPGWYKHLTETMARIPYRGQPRGVADNLVHARHTLGLTMGRGSWRLPTSAPNTITDLGAAFDMLLGTLTDGHVRVPREESWHYVDRVLAVLTPCEERLFDEYENTSWWEFVGASSRSPEFQRYLVSGLTKNLVACRAQELSARTVGIYLNHLFFDLTRDGADRVLNGPTTDVFLRPWIEHLQALGVEFRTGVFAEEIYVEDGLVSGVRVRTASGSERVEAEVYVSALPSEVMARLCSRSLVEAAPSLAGIGRLRTDWMNGAQFYLDREVSIAPGHTIYLDSPWSITSISQGQFWPQYPLERFGDGQVRTILSIDISDWNTPGILFGKPARACTHEEIRAEAWAQLTGHLAGPEGRELREAKVLAFYLDEAVQFVAPDRPINHEPLLINTVGSWALRPNAVTEIPNLFLAADYVRTESDVASMEAANEAGRRAVNGILDATSCNAPACVVHRNEVPAFAVPLRAWDKVRYRNGLPHWLPSPLRATDGLLRLADRGLRAMGAAAERLASGPSDLDAHVVDLDWKASAVLTSVRYGIDKALELFERGPTPPPSARPPKHAPGLRTLEEVSRRNDLATLERDLQGMRALVEQGLVRLDDSFAALTNATSHGPMQDAVRGILALPGKRNRALAAYVAAYRGRGAVVPAVHNIALAVELVHAATLLHDDVIDQADVRRGAPAPRITFGNAASILGGDELFVSAVESVTEIGRPDLVESMMAAMRSMLAAEASQLDNRGQLHLDLERCLEINRGKTASLFRWAAASGAIVAGHVPERVTAAGAWGEHFGMAYQLVDDVLDLAGDPSAMGKTLFTDLAEGKLTYPVVAAARADRSLQELIEGALHEPARAHSTGWASEVRDRVRRGGGIDAARARAREHAEQARAALASLPMDASRAVFEGITELSLERAA